MKDTENLPPEADSDECKTCGHEWTQHKAIHSRGPRFSCEVDGCTCKLFVTSEPQQTA
jgi:hypothetical protein